MSCITAGLATICKLHPPEVEWNLQRLAGLGLHIPSRRFRQAGLVDDPGQSTCDLSLGCTFANLTTTTRQKRRFRALRSVRHCMEPGSCPFPRAGRSHSVVRREIWGIVWGAPVWSPSLCMCTVGDLRRHPCPISHSTPRLSFPCRSHETKFRRPFR